ncbi:MAG: hypothetical protein K0Q49_2063 [Haloplasmataceae bacterium]|nr:hypothetical protein [Haloplasmataceae bacterium]
MKKYLIILTVIVVSILSGCFYDTIKEVKPTEVVVKPRTITVDTQSPESYTIDKNQVFILSFKIDNPKKLDVISVIIDNELYSNFQFEADSTSELINIKLNSGEVPGVIKYTLTSVKAIEGNQIVNLQATNKNSVELFVNYTIPSIKTVALDHEYYHKNEKALLTIEFDNPDNQEIQYLRINGNRYDVFEEGSTNTLTKLFVNFNEEAGDQSLIIGQGLFADQVVEFTINNTVDTYILKTVPEVADINFANENTPIELGSTVLLSISFNNDDAAEIKSIKLNEKEYESTDFQPGSTYNQILINYPLTKNPIQTIKLKEIHFSNGKEDFTYVLNDNLSIYINEAALNDEDI